MLFVLYSLWLSVQRSGLRLTKADCRYYIEALNIQSIRCQYGKQPQNADK